MKRFLQILLCLTFLTLPLRSVAQNVRVKGKVTVRNGSQKDYKEVPERVLYSILSPTQAKEAKAAFDKLTKTGFLEEGSLVSADFNELDRLKKKYYFSETNNQHTNRDGSFNISAPIGTCLLFLTLNESKPSEIVEVVEAKTGLNIVINVMRSEEVIKSGSTKYKPRQISQGVDGDTDSMYFEITYQLEAGWAKNNSRLIIQPIVVDCQTEDTMEYSRPFVYEGEKYHSLQNKRMNYNYFRYDSLSRGYEKNTPLQKGEPINVYFRFGYKKKDRNKIYQCPYTAVLEDYHHTYHIDEKEGNCFVYRPFKLLDFTPALKEIELTEEFKEDAGVNTQDKTQDLNLRFVVGRDELANDSTNDIELDKLKKELQDLQLRGTELMSASIIGMASPDGNAKTNEALALRRAQRAVSLIQPYLSSSLRIKPLTKVHTWEDVAQALEKKGKAEEAEQVRALAKQSATPDRQLRQLDFYEQDVLPILERMRAMELSYSYLLRKILEPEEAVDEYLQHKSVYQTRAKDFTNGDYWNLFNTLTDSVELDTLTMIAYRHITENKYYATDNIMAPYICNRVAVMNLKKGTPNPRILEPFIDLSRPMNGRKPIDDFRSVKVNRPEILMNQAIAYYQEMKTDSANMFIEWLEEQSVNDPSMVNLKRYLDLKKLHFKPNRTPEEERAYDEALRYVLGVSDENKAILYTEIPNLGSPREAMKYVDKLPDTSPKKWYLKALLWIDKAGKEKREELNATDDNKENRIDIGGGFYLLTEDEQYDLQEKDQDQYNAYLQQLAAYKEEHGGVLPEIQVEESDDDDDINTDDIPYYMAYFQRAFEISPLYKRYYFSEYHVPQETRKKYKYKNKNIPAYQKLFQQLKDYEDRKLAKERDVEDDTDTGRDNENLDDKEPENDNAQETTDTATL